MTREEIMGLSKLTEGQQIVFLNSSGILEFSSYSHIESLADCAERLWREAGQPVKIVDAMLEIEQKIGPECYADASEGEHESWYWWAFCALPINRIQAALLALKRAGEENG